MQLAIIGLPFSGKTTVFNAVTRGSAQVAGYSGVSRPNVGVAKVPDRRLAPLVSIYRPTRTTQAEIAYVDLPRRSGRPGPDEGHIRRVPEPPPDGGRARGNRARLRRPLGAGRRGRSGPVPRHRDDALRADFRRPGEFLTAGWSGSRRAARAREAGTGTRCSGSGSRSQG